MEPDLPTQSAPVQASVEQERSTPWGVIIALTLILVIIVSGAYYAFTKRYAPALSQDSSEPAA